MTPIEKANARRAELKASGVPQRNKTWAERYAAKPKNLRLAVALHCVNCMGGPDVPSVREFVRGCTANGCALHPWRPYRWPGEERPTARKGKP